MLRKALVAALAVASFAVTLAAQNKPNFSGTWKLNTAKSDFGVMPGPESRTETIAQTDASVKESVVAIGTPQGDQKYTLTYALDGSETVNSPAPGLDIKNTAKWEGPALIINSKLKFQDQDVEIKSTWTLADDGKSFAMNAHIASAMGEFDQKMTFDKQEGGSATTTAASVTPSGAKANLTGTWKLNVAKSDFGVLPGPDKETFIVEHNDPVIKITVNAEGPQGKQDYVIESSTDGKEHVNKIGGNDIKSTAAWEGGNLVSTAKTTFQDQDVTIKNTYVLSEDGKILTVNSHLASAMGETDQKMIFEKQL